jgi:broad specificity phosphatase PhoE
MGKFLAIVIALFAALMTAQPALAADTIYVMRHLQKEEGADPPLTKEGAAGAERLAALLAKDGITAVFASPALRAQQTAAPLARRLGLRVITYDPRDPQALAAKVASIKGAVLVVGHSNTVPDLVAHFGGERPAPLTEQDFGTVFVVKAGSRRIRQFSLLQPAN